MGCDLTSKEIIQRGLSMLAENPDLGTLQNIVNLRMAARLTWEKEEMGGLEHVQFAHRNGTPIVPVGHCCHPLELVKRGFVDGVGWGEKSELSRISVTRWPEGAHWYATVDGEDVVIDGVRKWISYQRALESAQAFMRRKDGR